jgi:hypothetical protein
MSVEQQRIVTVHGVLTLVMPVGTARQRSDKGHREQGNLACLAPKNFPKFLCLSTAAVGLDREGKDA